MNNDEFYIGWQAKAPDGLAKHTRKFLVVLASVVIFAGILLGISQLKFDTGTFEFGKLTPVTGIYSRYPVPSLRVASSKDIFGNSSRITVPLIGFGKFGADGVLRDYESQNGTSIEQMELTLKGVLLYNDGKLLMQVDGNDKPLTKVVKPSGNVMPPTTKELGIISVKGEIVDPKCYFGVMKPGQGKPHKDCAIRCILGGIPPVLRVVDKNGSSNYYFIVGPMGERLNEEIQEYVAEPVIITARAVQFNDWTILYTNQEGFQSISRRELFNVASGTVYCAATRTKIF